MTEQRIKRATLLQQEAVTRLIQSMCSEHFLFNTINTIYGMALVDGCYPTAKAIQEFAEDLRLSISEMKNTDIIFSSPA